MRAWIFAVFALGACGQPATQEADGGSDGAVAPPDLAMTGPDARLGANVEPGGVLFRVWAPHASAASVVVAGTPTSMTSRPGGLFEAHVVGAKAGDSYLFALASGTSTLSRIDPYCRQLDGAACLVVDPAATSWTTPVFSRPSRAASIVYELHVGSFTAGANFSSLADALPPLADLGVNVIELMPIQDFGGGPKGWGYNPQLFFAPKPSYGTSADLDALVDRAHSLGIAVWMDTVVNHTDGYSKAPLRCFDAPCAGDAGVYFFPAGAYATTPWGPRPSYPEPQVAAMLLASIGNFLDEHHGDGFRWDSVSNIRALDGNGTTPGGKELLVAANTLTHQRGAFSVAEDLKGYGAITGSTASGGFGFDAQWDGFVYSVDQMLSLANDVDRDMGIVVGALTGTSGGDPFGRVIFTEDHDIVGNNGARLPNKIDSVNPTSWTARKRSMLGAVLMMTAPGVPMLFQGQESLALGTFGDPPATLAAPTAAGLQIRAFYKDLIALRRNLAGKTGGLLDAEVELVHRNDDGKVVGFRRYGTSGQDVLVVLNFKNKAYAEYDIGVAGAGSWTIRLNTDATAYSTDFAAGQTGTVTAFAGVKDGKPYTLPLQLGAYSAMVLSR